MNNNNTKKSGFVSIIGRPSSGKSTLINKICGYKISIVSNQPQTTQFLVRGIYNDKDCQIIFIDTPGYHHFDSSLNKGLSNLAVRTLDDGDLILYVVDIAREFGNEEKEICKKLKNTNKDIIIAYNKIDLKSEKNSRELIKSIITPKIEIDVSGITGENIENLLYSIKDMLPLGPLYYNEDYVTDQSIPFRIKEIIREKVFNFTKDEIPHSTYIDIDSLDINDKKIICNAVIYVERTSQKGIIIGKDGAMIKKIGEESRIELKDIFERNVNLFLKVDIHHNWRKENKFLKKKFNLL